MESHLCLYRLLLRLKTISTVISWINSTFCCGLHFIIWNSWFVWWSSWSLFNILL